MIRYIEKQGVQCPRFVCEQCHKPIQDVTHAQVFWSETGNPVCLHTNTDCAARFDAAHKDEYPCWEPMEFFLLCLCNNTRMPVDARNLSGEAKAYAMAFGNA